jgi:predicted ATP-grasp superfamily ATP-dependent carboligase
LTHWRDLPAIAQTLPPGEWLYAGGLENHPEIVAEVCGRHRLLGMGSAMLRRVRDPFELRRVLELNEFSMPTICRDLDTVPAADSMPWLVKRRASGGGIGIERFRRGEQLPRGAYLQEFLEGEVWGASYLAAGGSCRLIGVCAHLGPEPVSESSFIYQGSIGPLRISTADTDRLYRLGETLTAEFGLVGLFGVDVIKTPDGFLRPLEVNPRYTSSMELFERTGSTSLIECHLQACRKGSIQNRDDHDDRSRPMQGKRIVYFEGDGELTISDAVARRLLDRCLAPELPDIADVPMPGTRLRRGDPIATVFAEDDDRAMLIGKLSEQSQRVQVAVASPD